jgi:glutamate racemase
MSDGYIAVLDSGIGGISLLAGLTHSLPNQNFLYFGDNDNAPYGNHTKQTADNSVRSLKNKDKQNKIQ